MECYSHNWDNVAGTNTGILNCTQKPVTCLTDMKLFPNIQCCPAFLLLLQWPLLLRACWSLSVSNQTLPTNLSLLSSLILTPVSSIPLNNHSDPVLPSPHPLHILFLQLFKRNNNCINLANSRWPAKVLPN